MVELTDNAVMTLVPEIPAPALFPQGVSEDFVNERVRLLEGREQRILRWLTSLQAFSEAQRLDQRFPGFQYFTYGFIPVGENIPRQVQSVDGYTFGIAIELEVNKSSPSLEIDTVTHGGVVFPLVINRRSLITHATPDPTNPPGTGACWGKSNKRAIKPASEGVLTAEHVVSGRALGSSVAMSSGAFWHLGDRGSCKLDAALIVQANSIPQAATPLGVQMTPVPPAGVSFHGSATGHPVSAKMTHAMIHSTYLNHANPMRVFFDNHGKAGDSGALVTETASGLGVGIYMGIAPVPGTTGEGIAQALSQAKDALRLDLFI